jgi:tetratricopeptide (TPR) repeat protein
LREEAWNLLRELGMHLPLTFHQSANAAMVGRRFIELNELVDVLRASYETLRSAGETGGLSTVSANLANALYEAGELAEAERFSLVSEETGSPDDVVTQAAWRAARAKVRARQDRLGEAEELARAAVAQASTCDYVETIAEAYLSLGEVLRLAGRMEEARDAFESALAPFARKGFELSADAVRTKLAELQSSGSPSQ